MPVLDIRTWPRGDIPGLGLTDEDIGFLRGWIVTSWLKAFNMIDRILIPPRYTVFSGSPPVKNSGVKRAWPGAILG
jgi:hypothetical protein